MLLLTDSMSNKFMRHEHRPYDIKLLEAKLTSENYKKKFHQLLCREEEEHARLLSERFVCVYIYVMCEYFALYTDVMAFILSLF